MTQKFGGLLAKLQCPDHTQNLVESLRRIGIDRICALSFGGIVGEEGWLTTADDENVGVRWQRRGRNGGREAASILLTDLNGWGQWDLER